MKMPAFDPIEYLVDRRFPLFPKVRVLRAATGTYSLENKRLLEDVEAYKSELRTKAPSEIDAMVEAERAKAQAELAARAAREEQDKFFNQPHARADFDHWSKVAYWSIDEALALSMGKDPQVVSWKKIEGLQQVSDFVRHYGKRRQLALRAVAIRQLTDGVLPGLFLGWAKRNELDVPEELVLLVEKRAQPIADWPALLEQCQSKLQETLTWAKEYHQKGIEIGKASAEAARLSAVSAIEERDKRIGDLESINERLSAETTVSRAIENEELRPKARQSLLKLLLGMAIDGYGFDPSASKSPIAKELADSLAELGISIDEDTVRSWLREAAETVDYALGEQEK
jgi:hypothetical protein